MIDLLRRCFPEQAATEAWQTKLRRIVPSVGRNLAEEPDLLRTVRGRCDAVLGLGQ